MTTIEERLIEFINSLKKQLSDGEIKSDKALLELNKWLGSEKESINQLEDLKKNDVQTKKNILTVVRQFPVIWSEKDLSHHVFPQFQKEEYIEYLSKISNSYKNLPVPNYKPSMQTIQDSDITNFLEDDLNEYVFDRDGGRDFYGLTFNNLQKLLNSFPFVTKFIVERYNDIISSDYNLSAEWCSANIVARFKGGDRKEPKRFRPLIILPIMVRIMDGILCKKLQNYVIKYNIIDTRVQKAVMKDSSGLWENVFEVNMRIKEMIEQEDDEKLFLFIDLVNAFGSVNYRNMLTILQRYNFNPQFSNYFERYYKNVFGIYQGETFKWKNGLFQGSALSNILFLIYIDFAMKNIFQDLKALQYIDAEYDLQDQTFAFVDDIVSILPKNERLPEVLELIETILGFYGFDINQNKTHFVIRDKSIETLEYNGITFKKATPEFAYLGHCLFIHKDEVLLNILEKTENCLTTIDSFNLSGRVKAYIYYINIFLRISRVLESFYLINGKTMLMEKIMKRIAYFIYRWGVTDYLGYGQKHFEYIFTKGTNKIMKFPNMNIYKKLVQDIEVNEKFQINENKIDEKNQDFAHIMGFETPDFETLEENLKNMKSKNYFPIEHYEKCSGSCYAENFVAWTD